MWATHLVLFRSGSLAAWTGLVVVVQNIVGSLFNSHLFDFPQGWAYVMGVGIAGGIVLKELEIVQSRAAESALGHVRVPEQRTRPKTGGV
jgi:hypothetical protein